MHRTLLLLMILMGITASSLAQKQHGIIRGMVVDSVSGSGIPEVTISLMQSPDSSFVTFTLTNKEGQFEFNGLAKGEYIIHIAHPAIVSLIKIARIDSAGSIVDLGVINPKSDAKMLAEVIVTNEAPIVVKGDTVQFNANAFKTRPNATVEDLLKKLPRVEVDREGNVKAQGETVQKVLVDGKEFFGDDPKLATKNLTADMVESVQVVDDMSEQARFTKIDDGNRTKTMNIKLKKDRNRGIFARGLAGYGDQGRYKANMSMNKFAGPERISVLFNANNINEPGFSFTDIISSMGGLGAMMGGNGLSSGGFGGGMGTPGGLQLSVLRNSFAGMMGGLPGAGQTGINRSLSAGINYSNDWTTKLKGTGSYFYSDSDIDQEQSM